MLTIGGFRDANPELVECLFGKRSQTFSTFVARRRAALGEPGPGSGNPLERPLHWWQTTCALRAASLTLAQMVDVPGRFTHGFAMESKVDWTVVGPFVYIGDDTIRVRINPRAWVLIRTAREQVVAA